MFFEEAQTSTDDLRFIIESAAGNTFTNELLKVWRNDFAHNKIIQQFPTVVNLLRGFLRLSAAGNGKSMPPLPQSVLGFSTAISFR